MLTKIGPISEMVIQTTHSGIMQLDQCDNDTVKKPVSCAMGGYGHLVLCKGTDR